MDSFTAAVVQASSKLFDTPATLDVFETKLKDAKGLGAELVVFPEAFIGGYPKGVDFGVRVGMRSDEGRSQFAAYMDGAISRQSPEMDRICKAVKRVGLTVVLGLIEKSGGTLYCSSACIGKDGQILSWHRKLMPTAMERVIWGQGDGSTMSVAKTDIGTVSMAICWENYMPLYRQHLYDQGTQLHCVPTVDDRDVWTPTLQAIALEGRCFVLSACQYMTVGDVAADWFDPVQGKEPDTVLIRGGSCIISPMGDVLAAPVYNEETILTAHIDLDMIKGGKFDLDVSGHYSRPDVFKLTVDKDPK